jgi:hypothetical protein
MIHKTWLVEIPSGYGYKVFLMFWLIIDLVLCFIVIMQCISFFEIYQGLLYALIHRQVFNYFVLAWKEYVIFCFILGFFVHPLSEAF